MKGNFNIVYLLMLTVAWWGLMYPEYCMGEEVVEMVYDMTDEYPLQEQEVEVWQRFLKAQPEEIIIKSRFYECIKVVFEK